MPFISSLIQQFNAIKTHVLPLRALLIGWGVTLLVIASCVPTSHPKSAQSVQSSIRTDSVVGPSTTQANSGASEWESVVPINLPQSYPYDYWFGLYATHKKIGYAEVELVELHDPQKSDFKYRLVNRYTIVKDPVHPKTALNMEMEEMSDEKYRLKTFRYTISIGNQQIQEVSGKVRDSSIYFDVPKKMVPILLNVPVYSSLILDAITQSKDIANQTFQYFTFDPTLMKLIFNTMRFQKENIILLNGVESKVLIWLMSLKAKDQDSWIIQNAEYILNTYKEPFKMAMANMELRREEKSYAMSDLESFDVSVAPNVPVEDVPDDIQSLTKVSYKIVKIPSSFSFPQDERQKTQQEVLTVSKPELTPGTEESLQSKSAGYSDEIALFLQGDSIIQTQDEASKKIVVSIAESKKSDWEKVVALKEWVNKNLAKEFTLLIYPSNQILQLKKGDCKHHAILLAALCRIAGIPCKLVSGLVHSKGLKGYYFHAWNEVYIKAQWISVDATFNQMPVDVTHIKIAEGKDWELESVSAIYKLYDSLSLLVVHSN